MLSCCASSQSLSLVPLKDGWTDFRQELSIPRISLKKPLSNGIVHHPKPPNSLKESTTLSRKEMRRYTKLRNESTSNKTKGMAAIVNKLENLGRDMKKLKESVHAIQVGCQTCGRIHLDKDCPLNEEVKNVEEVKYGEFGRSFPNNYRNDGRFNRGGYDQPSLGERRPNLTEIINKYMEEESKKHAEQDEWLKKFYQSTETSREAHDKIIQGLETKVKTLAKEVEGRANNGKFEDYKTICSKDVSPLYTPFYYSPKEIEYFFANLGFLDSKRQETNDFGMVEALAALEAIIKKEEEEEPKKEKQKVNYYIDPYKPPIPFPRRLEHHAEETLVHKTMESLKKIKINRPLLKEIRKTNNYPKHMKNLVENKPRTEEVEEIKMNPRCSALLQNHLPPKEQDPRSFILPCSLGKLDFNNALADLGASISIMPLSMYKRLGIGKLKPINMVIKMADNTKCTPEGIVEILLIKIDKFIFPADFIILDMVEDLRMPIILGRPLLATAYAKVDIFRKSISLEVGNEKVADFAKKGNERQYWASCNPYSNICDGGDLLGNEEKYYWESINDSERKELEWETLSLNDWMKIRDKEDDLEEDWEDPNEYGEDKAHAIMEVVHNKLDDEWFNNTNEDKDDLEGEIYTKIGCLRLPPAFLPVFPVIFIMVLAPMYDHVIALVARKMTKTESGITHLQLIGIGLLLSIMAMAVAALVENKWKSVAYANGLINSKEPLPITFLWFSLQYLFLGSADLFSLAGMMDFFIEAPFSMRSLATSLSWALLAMGYYLSSVLVSIG
ncbi:reverse transcriptase domain-containing protein [Tanacetum coccineum]